MAIERTPIHTETKGSLMQDEDWWTLIVDTDSGTRSVEHEWSHVDPNRKGHTDSGKTTVAVDEFLAGDADPIVKDRLRDLLKTAG